MNLLTIHERLGSVLIGISTVLLLLVEFGGIVLLALTGFMDEAVLLGFEQDQLASLVSVKIPLIIAGLRGAQAVADKFAQAIAARTPAP